MRLVRRPWVNDRYFTPPDDVGACPCIGERARIVSDQATHERRYAVRHAVLKFDLALKL